MCSAGTKRHKRPKVFAKRHCFILETRCIISYLGACPVQKDVIWRDVQILAYPMRQAVLVVQDQAIDGNTRGQPGVPGCSVTETVRIVTVYEGIGRQHCVIRMHHVGYAGMPCLSCRPVSVIFKLYKVNARSLHIAWVPCTYSS